MQFGLLGPLEVQRAGTVINVGAPRERLVLTVLLLAPNHVVPASQLIDIVWGEAPPPTAKHSLHVSISRLRAALDATGDSRIATQRSNYQVRVEPGELDLDRMRTLLTDAEAAGYRGDHQSAWRHYAAAAALWRSAPLAEFAGLPWADSMVAALEHDHERLVEGELAARLGLGQGAEIVGQLESLVHAHPGWERLRGQLMTALYQAGRQADALSAFQNARTFLREEFGVDPGTELRELHRAILQHEASISPPRTPAPAQEPPVGVGEDRAERRIVSILSACMDLGTVGSCNDLELHARAVAAFHDHFEGHVTSTGGVVEELTDTAARACFGGDCTEDHADRAIAAALMLRDDASTAPVRMGIASGEVLRRAPIDVTSGPLHRVPVSTGRPVAVADALAHEAVPGCLLIEPSALATARSRYELGPEHRLVAWGLVAHEVIQRLAAPAERTLGGLHRGFLGREAELAALIGDYRACVSNREPRRVTIVGDPGIGKSALLLAACRRLADEVPTPRLLGGQCASFGRGVTYSALAEVLRGILGVSVGEPATNALGALGDEGASLALVFGSDSLAPIHPAAARERLGGSWVRLLDRLCIESPVVLILEDVHWAEPPLLELLDRLGREVNGPLLIVASARPEYADRASPPTRRTSLRWLEPLSDGSARELLDQLLGARTPPPLADVVVERAEGYPFFVEELLATLIERNLLVRLPDGGWSYLGSGTEVLPANIRALLAARVDLLAPGQKSVLQAAAVVGRRFDPGLVRRVIGAVELDFPGLLERDLLRQRRDDAGSGVTTVAGQLEFKHALTRDVAYASLSASRRAHLHAAVARDLEATGMGDDLAAILAHHFATAASADTADLAWEGQEAELATLRSSAIEWLLRAGRHCIARSAIDEGISLLEHALAFDPPDDVKADAWRAIGRGHALRYDGSRCWSAILRAVELYSDQQRQGAALAELAMETVSRYGMMDMPDRELVDSWIDQAIALSEPSSPAHAQALVARTIWFPADPRGSAEEAVAAAEKLGDPALCSRAYGAHAAVCYITGNYPEADDWADRMLALVPSLDDPDAIVDVYGGAVPSLLAQGRYDLARTYVDEHGAVAWTLSDHHRVHAVSMHLELEEVAGNWPAIRSLAEQTEAIVAANSATPCQRNARSPLVCAYAFLVAGESERAGYFEALAEEQALDGHNSILNPMRLRLAIERGDIDTVRALVQPEPPPPPWKHWYQLVTTTIRLDALCTLEDQSTVEREAPPLARSGTYWEPFALEALGRVRADFSLLEGACAAYGRLGLIWHQDRLRARIDTS